MKILKVTIFSLILCLITAPAFAEVHRISNWARRGLTGGGNALDGIAGVSISPYDTAYSVDVTGNTAYVHVPQDTGVTTENSPYVITPDSLQASGNDASGGTTTWRVADSYVSRFNCWELQVQGVNWIIGTSVQAYDVDTAKVDVNRKWTANQDLSGVSPSVNTPTDNSHAANKKYVDDEDANGDTAFGWGDHSGAGYLSGDTNAGSPTGTWDFTGGTVSYNAIDMEAALEAVLDLSDLQAGVSNVFDKGTDTLDQVPDGSTYKLLTATKEAYLDQDVTNASTPVFGGGNITAIPTDNLLSGTCTSPTNTQLNQFISHRTSSGSDHTYLDQDVTSGSNPTFGTPTISDLTGTAVVDGTNLETNLVRAAIIHTWQTVDGYLDDSAYNGGVVGILSPAIEIPFNCTVQSVFLWVNTTSSVTAQAYYLSGSDNPGSGDSLFVVSGASIVSGISSYDTLGGATTLAKGDSIRFALHGASTSVSAFSINLGVTKN